MCEVLNIQAEEWNEVVLNSDYPVVVDFWHKMCGWCLKLNPVFAQLPEHFEGVKFVKLNVLERDENRVLAMNNGVLGTPIIKIFCSGREIGEIIGFRPLNKLIKNLKEILSEKDECLETGG